jgi:hypothetical protein
MPGYLSAHTTTMRNILLLRWILAIAVVFTASFSHAQDAEYRTAVKEYMKASGSLKAFDAALDQMLDIQKQTHPDVPEEFWLEARKEMNFSLDYLIEKLIPIYKAHFTIDNLRDITAFYRSPSGQKLAAETPALLQESMQMGMEWGQEVGARIAQRILDRKK